MLRNALELLHELTELFFQFLTDLKLPIRKRITKLKNNKYALGKLHDVFNYFKL